MLSLRRSRMLQRSHLGLRQLREIDLRSTSPSLGPDGDSGILAAQRENQYSASQLPETKEEQPMSTATETLKKVRVSMMNAIHDLPLLVARDEGFFKDEW